MTHVLITGTLFRAPEQRQSKAGKPFVSATIRVKDGDTSQFWKVVAFGETAQNELMRLADGDTVSIQGPLKAEVYRPESGDPRLSLGVIADTVMALRQPAKERRPKTNDAPRQDTRSRAERCAGAWAPEQGLSDEIPF
jgi:single-stranded DNA-binding protein